MGDWTSQKWTKRDRRNNQEQEQQEKKATFFLFVFCFIYLVLKHSYQGLVKNLAGNEIKDIYKYKYKL
jgi:hypothetical protein